MKVVKKVRKWRRVWRMRKWRWVKRMKWRWMKGWKSGGGFKRMRELEGG